MNNPSTASLADAPQIGALICHLLEPAIGHTLSEAQAERIYDKLLVAYEKFSFEEFPAFRERAVDLLHFPDSKYEDFYRRN